VALEALIAAGADATDDEVLDVLGFYAKNQQASGAWQSFGADDPNSTALGIIGITAAGFDVESRCWRDTADPSALGVVYVSPTAWIRSQQEPDGRIASPNDAFPPINTFATSQSVEGLLQSWLPMLVPDWRMHLRAEALRNRSAGGRAPPEQTRGPRLRLRRHG